jgi:ribosome-associated translation inhibitor RaiA
MIKPFYHGDKNLRSYFWEEKFEKKLNRVPLLDDSATVDVYLSKDNQIFKTKVIVHFRGKEFIADVETRDSMYDNQTKLIDTIKEQLVSNKRTYDRERPEFADNL